MPSSPNMALPIPVVGTTAAPDWATLLVSCLNLVDTHDHTTGNGVPITSGALNINADLSMAGHNLTAILSSRYSSQGSPLAGGTDLGCIYVSGADLYYNDTAGNQVRMTQNGGVAGSPGSISNLSSPASAAYVAASGKFVWQQGASTSADMDFGSWISRNDTASSFALTVQPPTLSGNQTITLPLAPAGSTKIMAMSTSGIMTAPYSVDGSTIAIAANIIGVPNGGITTTQIASATILTGNIAAGTILGSNIAAVTIAAANIVDATLTGTQMSSNIDLPGNLVTENGKALIVSSTNAASSLKLIRGRVNSSGTLITGEGFTSARNGIGVYTITFSSAFASEPCATATLVQPGSLSSIWVNSIGTGTVQFEITNAGGAVDTAFQFIVIGPR